MTPEENIKDVYTSARLHKSTVKMVNGLESLKAQSFEARILEIVSDRRNMKKRLGKASVLGTADAHLAKEHPCTAYRYDYDGFFWCGRDAPKRVLLDTLKQCAKCRTRMDQRKYLDMQTDLQKQRIHAHQLSINRQIRNNLQELYAGCEPEEKHEEYGYEIKSEKCRNEVLRNKWHPPEVCPLDCPYLKRLKIKKKRTA